MEGDYSLKLFFTPTPRMTERSLFFFSWRSCLLHSILHPFEEKASPQRRRNTATLWLCRELLATILYYLPKITQERAQKHHGFSLTRARIELWVSKNLVDYKVLSGYIHTQSLKCKYS